MGLMIRRKPGERVLLTVDDSEPSMETVISVEVVRGGADGGAVHLRFEAPDHVEISRAEVA
jgi:sRNA-binding carbon storage regulator CsrA